MAELRGVDKVMNSIGKATDGFGKFTQEKSAPVVVQMEEIAGSTKEFVSGAVEKFKVKKPDPYEAAIADYNGAYTAMNDRGLTLFRQRERSGDLIEFVEQLVNSIANTPKSFNTDFEEIRMNKKDFLDSQEFSRKELEAARNAATGAGAGFIAGAAVASMAPSAALWAATTFGTASTGTAISTLSGAAATNSALAWLGGGALAAGGGGTAAGNALIALAGPVGWTIAGATILTSIVLFTKKKVTNNKDKQENLTVVKLNTTRVTNTEAQINNLLEQTSSLREELTKSYSAALPLFGTDFLVLAKPQQAQLAALVNNTKACAAQLSQHIELAEDSE